MSKYSKLGNTAKNLYSYIATNTGDIFDENLLIERAVIQNNRKCDNQTALKKALNELKSEYIIKNFKLLKKDGQRQIIIDKFDENN